MIEVLQGCSRELNPTDVGRGPHTCSLPPSGAHPSAGLEQASTDTTRTVPKQLAWESQHASILLFCQWELWSSCPKVIVRLLEGALDFLFQIKMVTTIGRVSEGWTASPHSHVANKKKKGKPTYRGFTFSLTQITKLKEQSSPSTNQPSHCHPGAMHPISLSKSTAVTTAGKWKQRNSRHGRNSTNALIICSASAREESCSSRTLIPIANTMKYLCTTTTLHDTSQR